MVVMKKTWAPLLAVIFAAVLYWPMVDSVFYFLHGLESQGLLLATALAQGHGFVDLSLPGHPAHVREPPLFYLMLSWIIRAYGLQMRPLKVFIFLNYLAAALAGAAFFQRRSRPLTAFLATALVMSSPGLFGFFTGPKSDIIFMALALSALLFAEMLFEKRDGGGAKPKTAWLLAALFTSLSLVAVFVRSLGLALVVGGCGAALVGNRASVPLRRRVARAAALAAPVVLALGLWAWRGSHVPNPAGYNYVDWFMMDLKSDDPMMTAVDFHAPLLGPVPRALFSDLVRRVVRHAAFYPASLMKTVFDPLGLGAGPAGAWGAIFLRIIPFLAFAVAMLGLYQNEKKRAPVAPIFLACYSAAILLWPMDDPRLLFPLLPFAAFYLVAGFESLVGSGLKFWPRRSADQKERKRTYADIVLVLALVAAVGLHLRRDLDYRAYLSRLPTVMMSRGFDVRFLSPEIMESFELLSWVRDHAAPGAVIMYHSPPPCRLVSGHDCVSIPFSGDMARVRGFIVNGGADYVVLDRFGEIMPMGPGWFVEHVLRPVTAAFPEDFESVYRIPGTGAEVVRVRREK